MNSYQEFLETKRDFGANKGFEPFNIPDFLFDFQKALTDWAIRKGRGAIFADCGMGKGQPYGSKILTPTGWKKIEDLKVGDMVISSSGQSSQVQGVYPKSEQDIYKISFSDNTSFVVDADHLHICRTNNDRQRSNPWRVMSTTELINSGNLRYGKDGKSRNYDIPIVQPVEFGNDANLLIHPYLLGVLLGDGNLSGNIRVSSADTEIIDSVKKLLPKGIELTHSNNYDWRIKTGSMGNKRHPFRQALFGWGLLNKKSHQKFVPSHYLFSSISNRLELLRGLMDTDGHIDDNGCSLFYSTSEQLADDVIHLVQSLGGVPTKREKQTSCNGKKGKLCYIVTFSLNTFNPFSLKRKAKKWNPAPRGNGRWIDRIEYSGRQKTICISVSSKDESYVTENFIVTHNTAMYLVWADNVIRKTNKPVLVLTPLAVSWQTVDEAHKFGIEAYRASPDKNPKAIQVTNYERLHYYDPRDYGAVVCDESSILKNFDGVRKAEITEFMRQVDYRLLCTATAAPNDWPELGTSSEALGYMGYTDMLGKFFRNRNNTIKSMRGRHFRDKYYLRKYAEEDFWKWVVSWARAARYPSDLGFDDDGFILPEMVENDIEVKARKSPNGMLPGFDLQATNFFEEREAIRRTITERCEAAAEQSSKHKLSIVWCHLNDEGSTLKNLVPNSVEISGTDSDEKKEEAIRWFIDGPEEERRLISKPKIFGLGMNFQHSHHCTYFPTHSYEYYYQATRRQWRFGQKDNVIVDRIFTNGGKRMLQNLNRKAKQADKMFTKLVAYMNDALHIEDDYEPIKTELPEWI